MRDAKEFTRKLIITCYQLEDHHNVSKTSKIFFFFKDDLKATKNQCRIRDPEIIIKKKTTFQSKNKANHKSRTISYSASSNIYNTRRFIKIRDFH